MEDSKVKILTLNRFKRQVIVRLLLVPLKLEYTYVAVGRFGKVAVYNSEWTEMFSYDVNLDDDSKDITKLQRRISPNWITDSAHELVLRTIVFSSSGRCLHFFQIAANSHLESFRILYLPEIPTCLVFSRCEKVTSSVKDDYSDDDVEQCRLFIGDNSGGITLLTFFQPRQNFFRQVYEDEDTRYYQWKKLVSSPQHENVIKATKVTKKNFHEGSAVIQMAFYPEHDTLISCSRNREVSLIKYHFGIRGMSYVFHSRGGISCFDYRKDLCLIATGNSTDGVILLWNAVVTRRPSAKLRGHQDRIVDVSFCDHLPWLISLDMKAELRLWSTEEETCMTSIKLDFAAFSTLGRKVEFSSPALVWDSLHPGKMLIVCRDQVALVEGKFSQILPASDQEADACAVALSSEVTKSEVNPAVYEFLKTSPSSSRAKSKKNSESKPVYEPSEEEITAQMESLTSFKFFHPSDEQESYFPNRSSSVPALQRKVMTRLPIMKRAVKNGTPYLGLPVVPLTPMEIPDGMPVSERMKRKGILMRSVEEIQEAPLPLDPLEWFSTLF